MSKRLAFVIDKPLHGNIKAQEFLDEVLMASAFDQHVMVFFVGDGVYALLKQQRPDVFDMKNLLTWFDALPLYDINDVSLDEASLANRGLTPEQLHVAPKLRSRAEINNAIQSADHVFSF